MPELLILLIVITVFFLCSAGVFREKRILNRKLRDLRICCNSPGQKFDPDILRGLPAPVERYFRKVLIPGTPLITMAVLSQHGILRTSPTSHKWMPFSARQEVVPGCGFIWNARVKVFPLFFIRVLDSFIGGLGAGRVSFWGVVPAASESGGDKLNSGALYRYLAEAVWFPTALLPQAGVVWTSIDDNRAVASLTIDGVSASLEFGFSRNGEIESIYTESRYGKFSDGYRQVPWEGRFSDYRQYAGMMIPSYGEVGWYNNGVLNLVWKGWIKGAEYEL